MRAGLEYKFSIVNFSKPDSQVNNKLGDDISGRSHNNRVFQNEIDDKEKKTRQKMQHLPYVTVM